MDRQKSDSEIGGVAVDDDVGGSAGDCVVVFASKEISSSECSSLEELLSLLAELSLSSLDESCFNQSAQLLNCCKLYTFTLKVLTTNLNRWIVYLGTHGQCYEQDDKAKSQCAERDGHGAIQIRFLLCLSHFRSHLLYVSFRP